MSQSIVEIRYFHTQGVEGLRTIGSVLLSLVLWGGGVSDMSSEMDLKENHREYLLPVGPQLWVLLRHTL